MTTLAASQRLQVMGQTVTPLLVGSQTGDRLAQFEVIAVPGECVPPHTHTKEDEAWYVLEGTLEVTIAGATRTLQPGDTAFGPRGMEHTFRNPAETPCRMILTCTPAGFEHFFTAAAAHFVPGAAPDLAGFAQTIQSFGMTFPATSFGRDGDQTKTHCGQ